MSKNLAYLISYIFNPVLILVLLPFFLLYHSEETIFEALVWTIYGIVYILILGVFIFYGIRKKFFVDWDVSKREQRPLLFLICFILVVLYLSGLSVFHGPHILSIVAFGLIFGLLIVSIINTRIKASIHVAGFTSLIFSIALVNKGHYYWLLLLVPVIAWSRIKIKRHTVKETITGALLGILLPLLMYIIITVYL